MHLHLQKGDNLMVWILMSLALLLIVILTAAIISARVKPADHRQGSG